MATLESRPDVRGERWQPDEVDGLCVNTIRCLSIDGVEQAGSGHPGLPLGAAPMAHVLFTRFLRHNPGDPAWPDRDRFVLSAGHGSMLLYSLLHLSGYDLPIQELRRFRQWGSRTPGHPEVHLTSGVEATTGPLGQGISNAVGMAIAERMLAHRFNRPGCEIVAHRTFALVSDGDLMEGVALEAASLAGHLGLGRLTCLYDSNQVSLDGPTNQAFTEDVLGRFAACGWQVLKVEDGNHDLAGIAAAIEEALADETRPALIEVRTTIGYGSPSKAGTAAAHGAPLGPEELLRTKKALGWHELAEFAVPESVRARMADTAARGRRLQEEWEAAVLTLHDRHPSVWSEWRRRLANELPPDWRQGLPRFEPTGPIATRKAGGACLQGAARALPELVGGDADLSSSTNTRIVDGGDFDAASGAGRNIHFGVREHAMGAICNGIAYHGGLRPFAATFFAFSDYMRPPIRLAALNGLPVVYVFTHDSIGLGEDGPTHQPVEHLASLRAMPNLVVIRPADACETAVAWRLAIERRDGPTALVLTRQSVPVLPPEMVGDGPTRGAYVLAGNPRTPPDAVLMATGSEVHVALEAAASLEAAGLAIRVVSMPSWELFERQPAAYRQLVLAAETGVRVAIEAAASFGWDRYVGPEGRTVAVDRFGASAPGPVLKEQFGLTAQAVARTVRELLQGGST
jgi:transketolase